MATQKTINPKDTGLEADILKEAANTPEPVNQAVIKETAAEITGKEAAIKQEPMAGSVPASFGNPAPGTQVDPDYLEYLEWKKKNWVAKQLEGDRLSAEHQEQEKREKAASEAAQKAYEAVMNGQDKKADDATALHTERLKIYGQGYVVAKRMGVEQIFTRTTWNLLGGRSNKDGYTEVIATPPEVSNMKKA